MARPKKYINKKQFESLCAIQCTREEICDVLDVTEKTLNRWCKEEYGENFSLVFRQKKSLGKTSLRRNQWKLAEAGNYTMQIWLGKQMLGQSENAIQDQIKLKELQLKEQEFKMKENILLKELELKIKKLELDEKRTFGDENDNNITIKVVRASDEVNNNEISDDDGM